MTKDQEMLFEFIDDLLWYEWDPLGISQHGLGDAYQSYVPQIFDLAIGNATVEQITDRLRSIERDIIGGEGDFEKCKRMAQIIVQKKQVVLNS